MSLISCREIIATNVASIFDRLCFILLSSVFCDRSRSFVASNVSSLIEKCVIFYLTFARQVVAF